MKGFQLITGGCKKVAVLRALPGLGDMLCAVPALRSLRAALPEAHITLIGLPQSAFILQRYHGYVDELMEFPGYPGLPEREPPVRDLPAFFSTVQGRGFDLLLQMHGSGMVTNPLAMLMGARRTAGFYEPGQYCPDESLFLAYPEEEPEVRRHLRLLAHLGLPVQDEALEFPLRGEDWRALEQVPGARDLEAGGYVCIHPGASVAGRRWPARHFAQVADQLAARGLPVVLTGSQAERPLVDEVEQAMAHPAINLAGHTGLGSLAALLSRARLLICNDTGVSHLAAALRTPSVILFIATPPARWAPLDRDRHRVVENRAVSAARSGGLQWRDDEGASVDAVLMQAAELLEKEYGHAVC